MTEAVTEQTQTPAVQKDENGYEIITGTETWHFIEISHFPSGIYCIFRRLVSHNGRVCAAVGYKRGGTNNAPGEGDRYIGITSPDLELLRHCKEGDALWIIEMRATRDGKTRRMPLIFSMTPSCGKQMTEKEWHDLTGNKYYFPETYTRIVEV